MCRLRQTFFGLEHNYIKNVYEQFFVLTHHSNWSFQEAYNLPIGLRMWFVKRVIKQFEDENKAAEEAQRRKN